MRNVLIGLFIETSGSMVCVPPSVLARFFILWYLGNICRPWIWIHPKPNYNMRIQIRFTGSNNVTKPVLWSRSREPREPKLNCPLEPEYRIAAPGPAPVRLLSIYHRIEEIL